MLLVLLLFSRSISMLPLPAQALSALPVPCAIHFTSEGRPVQKRTAEQPNAQARTAIHSQLALRYKANGNPEADAGRNGQVARKPGIFFPSVAKQGDTNV
jgi:hypothetical protein